MKTRQIQKIDYLPAYVNVINYYHLQSLTKKIK